jgi:hypothetical protein
LRKMIDRGNHTSVRRKDGERAQASLLTLTA